MKNILNRGFSSLSINDLIALVMTIISKLTANVSFPTTSPTLAALQAQLDVVEAALLIVDPVAREEAVAAGRADLEQMLDDLADSLESTALMNRVPLATTGFPFHKETTQTTEAPPAPTNLRLRHTGTSGQAKLLFDPSERGRSYEVQTAPDPVAGPWTTYDIFSSSRDILLTGFLRAKDLFVRARANGPHNTKSGWSDIVSILID